MTGQAARMITEDLASIKKSEYNNRLDAKWFAVQVCDPSTNSG